MYIIPISYNFTKILNSLNSKKKAPTNHKIRWEKVQMDFTSFSSKVNINLISESHDINIIVHLYYSVWFTSRKILAVVQIYQKTLHIFKYWLQKCSENVDYF